METPADTLNSSPSPAAAGPAQREPAQNAGYGAFILASFVLNLFLGWTFQSDLGQLAAVGWCCIIGLGMCIVFGLIGSIGNTQKDTIQYNYKAYGKWGAFWGLVLMTSVASGFFGTMFREASINDACRYCDKLMAVCEEYRAKNGRYPEKVSDVADSAGRPPWLLEPRGDPRPAKLKDEDAGLVYSPASDVPFAFSFGMSEKFWYNSQEKSWYSRDSNNSDAPGPHKFDSAQGFAY